MAVRFSIAFVTIGLVCIPKYPNIDKKTFFKGLFLGVILFCGNAFQTMGILDTTPGKNAFLTTSYCVLVPFVYWMLDKKRPDMYDFIAAFVCIVGIGFISLTDDLHIRMGDALTLCAGIIYSYQIVIVSKITKEYDVLLLIMLQFGFSALFSWVAGMLFETMPGEIPGETVLSIAYLSFMPTLAATVFQNYGQKYASPTAAAVLMSLESVFGVLFSVLFYGEELTPRLVVGFSMVFTAVILSETKLSFLRRKKKAPAGTGET